MELKQKENIGWIDLLRVIACFLVVVSHCCDPFVAGFGDSQTNFLTGVFTGSMVRPCVPLFVMMTGVLLLPTKVTIGEFYKKRIGRIVIPLVFWSLLLPVLFFTYFNYINPGTESPSIVLDNHTLSATLNKMYTFIFNFNFDTTPLWYLYMLIGLYLVMPVISAFMKQATQKELRIFLYVWVITLVLPYVKMLAPLAGYTGNYGNMGILGICDWNDYGTFYYFSGFIGYLVLAYYLVKYPLSWSWKKTWSICLPMFLIGYLITSVGFLITQQHYPGNYAYLEIVWYFAGINVFMMTFPVFVIVQKIRVASRPWLSKAAKLSFGIYLCHFIFVQIAFDLFNVDFNLPPIIRILAMAVVSFLVSYLFTLLLASNRLTRRFVS